MIESKIIHSIIFLLYSKLKKMFYQYVSTPMYPYMQQPQQQVYHPIELPKVSLTISLPTYSYNTSKMVSVPFDIKTSNNGHFACVEDAMRYMAKHCMKHHKQFNRQLAKQYSSFCFVMDFITGQYVPLADCSKREFNAAFNKVSKLLH